MVGTKKDAYLPLILARKRGDSLIGIRLRSESFVKSKVLIEKAALRFAIATPSGVRFGRKGSGTSNK